MYASSAVAQTEAYLTCHSKLVTDLTFARSELSIQFGDTSGFDATCCPDEGESGISAVRSCGKRAPDAPPSTLSSAVDPVVIVTRSARRA